MPPPIAPSSRVRADLDALADALDRATFRMSADPARAAGRVRAVRSIRRYLIPRLADPEGPLLVVVFGSTGSGKSTLVNSLAGAEVTRAGTLRPTTRAVHVWCHPENVATLGRLRVTGDVEFTTDDHPDLRWFSLADTPDLDSIVATHRAQTTEVLAMADAVIHVTTPQRYADAVPWEFLADVARRDVPMLVVTNRLGRRTGGAVTDLAGLLRSQQIVPGITTKEIVAIQEQRLRNERLPAAAVKRVRGHLDSLARDHTDVVRRTVAGGIAAVSGDVDEILAALDRQRAEVDELRAAVATAVDHQASEIGAQLDQGDLVSDEVVQRWQRLIGVSDLADIVARGVGRLRDVVAPNRVVAPDRVEQVGREATEAIVDLAMLRVRRVHEAITSAWRLDPTGRDLIDDDLRTPSEDREVAADEVDAWMASLVDLVAEQGERRFRLARAASIGVNAAATTLLIAIFSATGGITGAEVGVTAGAAAAQQSLLEHMFGGAAARRLAETAQEGLVARITSIVAAEGDRFLTAVDALADPTDVTDQIDAARAAVIRSAEEWLDA